MVRLLILLGQIRQQIAPAVIKVLPKDDAQQLFDKTESFAEQLYSGLVQKVLWIRALKRSNNNK